MYVCVVYCVVPSLNIQTTQNTLCFFLCFCVFVFFYLFFVYVGVCMDGELVGAPCAAVLLRVDGDHYNEKMDDVRDEM